mgnify:CR=1 FL=1
MDFNKAIEKLNIELIIMFDSQVSGKTNLKSDVDIAILRDKSLSLEERSELTELLAKEYELNEDKIDLVEIKNASPILRFQIAEQGKLLWGDKSKFIRFRVLSWKLYLDTAKLRRVREKFLKRVLHVK